MIVERPHGFASAGRNCSRGTPFDRPRAVSHNCSRSRLVNETPRRGYPASTLCDADPIATQLDSSPLAVDIRSASLRSHGAVELTEHALLIETGNRNTL